MSTTISGVAAGDIKTLGNIPLSEDMYTKGQVETRLDSISATVAEEIASAISTVWKAGGSVAASGSVDALVYKSGTTWTAPLLVSGNYGKVYHLSEDYDITSDTAGFFKESSGTHIEAGTDIAVVDHPTVQGGYIYDVLAVTDSSVVKSVNGITPENGEVTIPTADNKENGLMTTYHVEKLNGISSGAEVNQNAFSNVAVSGQTTVAADTKTDTLTLVAGSNITITTNAASDSVTIAADVPAGVVTEFVTDSGTLSGFSNGQADIHGASGVSVYVSGQSVIVDGSGSVTGAKISGTSSLASGSGFQRSGQTIVIPTAATGGYGVTKLTNTIDATSGTAVTPYAVSGAISGVNSGLATKVGGNDLHSGLVAKSLSNPSSWTGNTIYALLAALHSVDGQSES